MTIDKRPLYEFEEFYPCPACRSIKKSKFGYVSKRSCVNGNKRGRERFICKECGHTFSIGRESKIYPKEFKVKVLASYFNGDTVKYSWGKRQRTLERSVLCIGDLVEKHGVSRGTIYNWLNIMAKNLNDESIVKPAEIKIIISAIRSAGIRLSEVNKKRFADALYQKQLAGILKLGKGQLEHLIKFSI